MTESEWLACEDPARMLRNCLALNAPCGESLGFVSPPRGGMLNFKPSDRKLRLFACACLFRSDQLLLKNADRYGHFNYGSDAERIPANDLVAVCRDWAMAQNEYDPPKSVKAAILRDIVGNPFRPATLLWTPVWSPVHGAGRTCPWLRWNDGAIPAKAQAMYDACDFADMPILADMLDDAGCDCEELLRHCRGDTLHVRGCWAIDLILGKE
jgi:hypothetical protein